jgi:hypothetical protein
MVPDHLVLKPVIAELEDPAMKVTGVAGGLLTKEDNLNCQKKMCFSISC